MRIEVIKINKSKAEDLLKINTSNRKPKDKVVKRYCDDMLKGNWRSNTGELIKVSKTNNLLDGQHRLLAIVKADVEVEMCIAYDLEDDIFDVLDTGSVRNSNDVFSIAKTSYTTSIPSIIQMAETFLQGGRHNREHKRMTNRELLEKFKENEDYYIEVAQNTHILYNKFAKVLSPALIGGLIIYFNSKSSADCELFFNELCTGQNVTNNTIYLLRNKLIEDKTSVKKMGREYINALIIKCWNTYRLRQELKVLKYSRDIEINFPVAI